MGRRCTAGAILLVGLIAGWSAMGQEAKKEKEQTPPSVWMKQKLSHSAAILEGLSRGDLDLVTKHAMALKALNKIEYFVRREPAAYRTQLHQFQFAIDEMARTSEEGNLDGATLAFTQMTISCVNCHKHLRKT